MPKSASHYPISQFINSIMDGYGFSRVEFLHGLGYRNLERGLRRLDPWLDLGKGYDRILKQIVAVYGRADELEKALAATKTIRAAEFEAAFLERCKNEEGFVPYIHAQGETTVPSGSICIFGITGGPERWTTIRIPKSILDSPVDQQLAALPDLMREYLKQYRGACPFFGKVTGFRFVRLIDYYQFDSDAVLMGLVNKPFRRGTCSVELR